MEHLETGRNLPELGRKPEAVSGSRDTRPNGPGALPTPPLGAGLCPRTHWWPPVGCLAPNHSCRCIIRPVQTKKGNLENRKAPETHRKPPSQLPAPTDPPTHTRGDAAPERAQRAADRASGATPLVAVTDLAKWPFKPSSLPVRPETRRRTCTARLAPPSPGRCFAHARTGGAAGRVSGPKS